MPLQLEIRHFRALEKLDWSPEGVCVLTGANGAGKTTTLDALRFLRALFVSGHEAAFDAIGSRAFRNRGTPQTEAVEFTVSIGDMRWQLRFPEAGVGMEHYAEHLRRESEEIIETKLHEPTLRLGAQELRVDNVRCGLKVLWDKESPDWLPPLVSTLEGLRIHDTYNLKGHIKRVEVVNATDSVLHPSGKNLWSVLANWKGAPLRYQGRFEWVMERARRAFPGILQTIEFDRGLPYLYPPGATEPSEGLLPDRAADGLLTGLLHLTAIAGADDGALVAFDEVENQLHPHAIRSLIAAMREATDERGLTVVLTTHSPVVLNQFRDEPEQVYVFGHGQPDYGTPASMDELHDEAWLAQAKLGSLYERLAFGAPAFEGTEE